MAKKKKSVKKVRKVPKVGKDLTIHFMPYSEIVHEDTVGRIKKIMGLILAIMGTVMVVAGIKIAFSL